MSECSSTNNNKATGPYDWGNTITTRPRILTNDNVQAGSAVSSGMTEQNLVNNNVSVLNESLSSFSRHSVLAYDEIFNVVNISNNVVNQKPIFIQNRNKP